MPTPNTYVPHRHNRLGRRSDHFPYNANRKFPLVVLLLGIGLLFAPIEAWGIEGIAILAAIIWIANQADMG